jgi:aspartyl-tRNA(Asn)/glutamyl-tRNA(Gln) amidotransferase subunit A
VADELWFQSLESLAGLIASRQVSSVDITRAYIERIERLDQPAFALPAAPADRPGDKLATVTTLVKEAALAAAANADDEIRTRGPRSPLHGLPYGVKDLLDTKGVRTTWGSQIFATRVPDRDAAVIERLAAAGAILVAKMTTAEFAGGSTSTALNPWKLDRSTQGSSSGTVAGTVAGLISFGIGTETGGSIVFPAAAVGATGLRPTSGRVSRYGCMPLAWSLDKIGPVARSARDCGLVLAAIAGHDRRDTSSSASAAFRFRREPPTAAGLRIGVSRAEFATAPAANQAAFERALEVLRRAGAVLRDITLPERPYAEVFMHVVSVESAAAFRELFESTAISGMFRYNWSRRADWMAASMAPAADYLKAQRIRQLIAHDADALLADLDLMVCPTFGSGAPLRDAPVSPPIPPPVPPGTPPDIPRLNWMANLSGLPGLSLPCGFDPDGLPLALHLVGRPWEEQRVLDVGMVYQQATDWHTRRPPYPWRA